MQKLKSISIQNIIIAIISFILGIFACVIFYYKAFAPIIQSLAILAAAFFGAWFAFLLESKSKKAEEINKQVSACNRAIFILLQRINKLRLYQREYIDPYRSKKDIFAWISASRDFEKDNTLFDIHSLNFLIDHHHSKLLVDLEIQDQSYNASINCINFHSGLHVNQVQPLLGKAGCIEGKDQNKEFFQNALGVRIYLTLERAVDSLIDNVDKTIENTIKVKDKFREVLKSIFHDKVFIDFEIIDKNKPNPFNKGDSL